jgi:hypothetical protein
MGLIVVLQSVAGQISCFAEVQRHKLVKQSVMRDSNARFCEVKTIVSLVRKYRR